MIRTKRSNGLTARGVPARLCTLLLLLLVPVTAAPAAEEPAPRIAVSDFDARSLREGWPFGWNWANVGRTAGEDLAAALVRTGWLRVIEPSALREAIGDDDPGRAADTVLLAKAGGRLGSRLFTVGRVTSFDIVQRGAAPPSLGKWKWNRSDGPRVVVGEAVIEVRLLDIATGEILGVFPGKGEYVFPEGETTAASLRDRWDGFLASQVLSPAVDQVARSVTDAARSFSTAPRQGAATAGNAPAAPSREEPAEEGSPVESWIVLPGEDPASRRLAVRPGDVSPAPGNAASAGTAPRGRPRPAGKVARVEGERIYVNLGAGDGVRIGDRFEVRRSGEEVFDPVTGESLGAIDEASGLIELTRVLSARLSVAAVLEGDRPAVGDRIVGLMPIPGPGGGLEGRVARADASGIYINLGSEQGLVPGDRLEIVRRGDPILDPDTGEELGAEDVRAGILEITRVLGGRLSLAVPIRGASPRVGDKVLLR